MKRSIKITYTISGVLIYLYVIIGGIVVGNLQVPLMGKLLFAASVIIAILIWVISLAKIHSKNPIVFEPEKYIYIIRRTKKIVLYVNYVQWQIVVQMLEHYGFKVSES